MKKNVFKIILDVIMFVVLFTMYSKSAVNMSYHEIGGLALCGLLIIHNGINYKWIVGVSKKFFGKNLPIRTRISYVINVLLFLSVTGIAVSGIMISKTIFTSIRGTWFGWKTVHYFLASLTIILMGVHLGLHWTFIKQMVSRMNKLPLVIARPIGVLMCLAVVVYGGYNLTATNFVQWLGTPVTMINMSAGNNAFAADQVSPTNSENGSGSAVQPQRDESHMKGDRPAGDMPTKDFAKGEGFGEHGTAPGSGNTFISFFSTLGAYGSIAGFFAFLTIILNKVFNKRKPNIKKEIVEEVLS